MFYLPSQGFFIGSFGVEYKYLLGIGIIALSVLHFLITADLRSAIRCSRDAMVLARSYLWCIAYSLIFWVVNMSGFRVMTRGTSIVLYQLIAIFVAAGTLYMFGSKGIYLLLLALAAALGLMTLTQMREVGVSAFIQQYVESITSFTANTGTAMRFFEKKGHTYAAGCFLIYFLLTAKEKRSHLIWAALSFLLFCLGMKRSVSLAICVGLIAGLLLSRLKKPVKWVLPVSVIGIGLALGFIVLVYHGLFEWLESIGISTSGRSWLYTKIRDFYYMSPAYLGKGAGFVATAFSNGVFDVSEYGFAIGDIHNDFLRQYIEYGFWGFLVWAWLYTGNKVRHFFHTAKDPVENRHGVIVFALVMASCVLFMTENSYYFYYWTLPVSLTIMGYRYEEFVKRTKLPGEET